MPDKTQAEEQEKTRADKLRESFHDHCDTCRGCASGSPCGRGLVLLHQHAAAFASEFQP